MMALRDSQSSQYKLSSESKSLIRDHNYRHLKSCDGFMKALDQKRAADMGLN